MNTKLALRARTQVHSASNIDGILSGCKIAARANLPRAVDAFIRELVSGTCVAILSSYSDVLCHLL